MRGEIAYGRAGKVDCLSADRHADELGQRQRPGVVGAHAVDVQPGERLSQPGCGRPERLARDIDGHIKRRLQLLDQDACPGARAAAELYQLAIRAEELRHRGGMLAHDREFGARGIVLRQGADSLEQLAAARIVEVLRRQRLLRPRQTRQHVIEEGVPLGQEIVEAHHPNGWALLRLCHRYLDSKWSDPPAAVRPARACGFSARTSARRQAAAWRSPRARRGCGWRRRYARACPRSPAAR